MLGQKALSQGYDDHSGHDFFFFFAMAFSGIVNAAPARRDNQDCHEVDMTGSSVAWMHVGLTDS